MSDDRVKNELPLSMVNELSNLIILLKQARQEQQLSLRDLSRRSGLPISVLSDYENDKHNPNLYRLALWAHVLGFKLTVDIEND